MLEEIREVCNRIPFSEKIVIGIGKDAANFIVRNLLKSQQGIIFLQFEPFWSFTGRMHGICMARNRIRYLQPGEGLLILSELVKPDGYFAAALTMPGFLEALLLSIESLSLYEIDPNRLTAEVFASEEKAIALRELYETYRKRLDDRAILDYPGLLNDCHHNNLLSSLDVYALLPGNVPLVPLERNLLLQAGNRLQKLSFNAPQDLVVPASWDESAKKTLFVGQSGQCFASTLATSFFCATSPQAEIREIARRIRQSGIPFEQIAIAIADQSYLNLLVADFKIQEIPCTIALPMAEKEFKPGRLAHSFCEWAESDFPVEGLVAMLDQGDLRLFKTPGKKWLATGKMPPGAGKIVKILREAQVRGGRNGYIQPLLAYGAKEAQQGRRETLAICTRIAKKIKKIISFFPENVTPGEMAKTLSRVVSRFINIPAMPAKRKNRSSSQFSSATNDSDSQPLEDLKRLNTLKRILLNLMEVKQPLLTLKRAMWWLKYVLQQPNESELFKPDGKVVVCSIAASSFCERKLIFYPGLSHSIMPGLPLTNPVLSEYCRNYLGMKNAEDRRREFLAQIYCSWAGLPEGCEVNLSMSLAGTNGQANSPSMPFLKALRQKLARSFAFEKVLNTTDLPLTGLLADDQREAIDQREWFWQQEKAGISRKDLYEMFLSTSCLWRDYLIKQELRLKKEAVICKGLQNWSAAKWSCHGNPGRTLSATGIEKIAGCAYSIFLSRVIDCLPEEPLEVGKPDFIWLNPLQRGNLLHEIFEVFLRQAGWPVNEAHRALLLETFEKKVATCSVMIPPPSQAVMLFEKSQILQDLLLFFANECKAASRGDSQPFGLEVSFGMKMPEDKDAGLDACEPVPFTLPDGRKVFFKGRIDRVDKTGQGFEIIDYKTGRFTGYLPGGIKHERAKLQLSLYRHALANLLTHHGVNGKVSDACLYFPTVKGQGEKVHFEEAQNHDGLANSLKKICDALDHGKFPGTPNCEPCNMVNICPFAAAFVAEAGFDGDDQNWEEN